MKRFLLLATGLLMGSIIFAQEEASVKKFSGVTFVSFKSRLTYNIGENTAAYPASRTLKPFAINKYETSYELWYQTRIKAEKIGYFFENPGQGGSNGKRGAEPGDENKYQPVTNISWYESKYRSVILKVHTRSL